MRVVVRAGEPWFVAADVCKVLEIKNGPDAMGRLDDDEKGIATTDTLGGAQKASIINESGLYSLILTSRKPEAKRFKRWVTGDVLPCIRKTGSYGAPAFALDDSVLLLSAPTLRQRKHGGLCPALASSPCRAWKSRD